MNPRKHGELERVGLTSRVRMTEPPSSPGKSRQKFHPCPHCKKPTGGTTFEMQAYIHEPDGTSKHIGPVLIKSHHCYTCFVQLRLINGESPPAQVIRADSGFIGALHSGPVTLAQGKLPE